MHIGLRRYIPAHGARLLSTATSAGRGRGIPLSFDVGGESFDLQDVDISKADYLQLNETAAEAGPSDIVWQSDFIRTRLSSRLIERRAEVTVETHEQKQEAETRSGDTPPSMQVPEPKAHRMIADSDVDQFEDAVGEAATMSARLSAKTPDRLSSERLSYIRLAAEASGFSPILSRPTGPQRGSRAGYEKLEGAAAAAEVVSTPLPPLTPRATGPRERPELQQAGTGSSAPRGRGRGRGRGVNPRSTVSAAGPPEGGASGPRGSGGARRGGARRGGAIPARVRSTREEGDDKPKRQNLTPDMPLILYGPVTDMTALTIPDLADSSSDKPVRWTPVLRRAYREVTGGDYSQFLKPAKHRDQAITSEDPLAQATLELGKSRSVGLGERMRGLDILERLIPPRQPADEEGARKRLRVVDSIPVKDQGGVSSTI